MPPIQRKTDWSAQDFIRVEMFPEPAKLIQAVPILMVEAMNAIKMNSKKSKK